MADITDLLSSLYDTLTKTFNSPSSPGSYFQFGWPGISLSPADFKLSDEPGAPYDANAAEETFSLLCNIAPACSAVSFANSGFEIDDLYQILLLSALPLGADPQHPLASPAYKLFSDAQYQLTQAQKGSNRDPSVTYAPCRATPHDWYTEASAQQWPTLSLTPSQIKQAEPSSPFIQLGGRKLIDPGVVRLIPALTNVETLKQQLQVKVTEDLDTLGPRSAPVARARALDVLRSRPAPAVTRLSHLQTVELDQTRFDVVPSKSMTFDKRVVLRRYLDRQLLPDKLSTTGFSLSFKYCLVNITRSWFNNTLLNMRTWYMAGTRQGEYSTGTLADNPGMFPMVQTSLLAIRDLRINAAWSPADRAHLARTKYLGPFDVSASGFNQDTLQANGLQVIGWLSRLTPVLPPLSPP